MEEIDTKRIEAERCADELAVNANDLNEELNTQHMELTSVIELEVCCIMYICVCI